MKFWIDAQLPPQLASWLNYTFDVEAISLKDLGLRDAEDEEIFAKAKIEGIVIITKDSDFIELVTRHGIPPQILWVTCGNVTNRNLKRIFSDIFLEALQLLEKGEIIVEIGDIKNN
jgi:predicted nuclease of predicted toxin-antitoxin system